MNKLFLLSVLSFFSFQPIQTMQSSASNSNALIVAGSVIGAGCVAIGGVKLANAKLHHAKWLYDHNMLNQGNYEQEKRDYLIRSAICGAVKFGSVATAALLLKAAHSGVDRQAILSTLALASGGAVLQASKTKLKIDSQITNLSNGMFAGGMLLTIGGIMGITNSSFSRFLLDFFR